MHHHDPGTRSGGHLGEVAVLLWIGVMSTAFFTLAPSLIGAFMEELHFSVRQAGLLSSMQLAGSAAGNVAVLLFGRLLPVRTALVASVAVLGTCDLTCAFLGDPHSIVLLRLGAGAAAGVAFAVVNAAASRLPRAGVVFSAIAIVQMLFGVVGFLALPWMLDNFGLRGAFLALGCCSLACAVSARRLTRNPVIGGRGARASLAPTRRNSLLLASLFVTYLGSTAIWTYLDRIGAAAGLARDAVSVGLALSMAGGIAGAIAAVLLVRRSEHLEYPLVFGAAALAVSTVVLINASSIGAYSAALFGFNGALMLSTPLYLASLAAQEFGDGHVVVAMLVMYLGLIGGPLLGADLAADMGYRTLVVVAALLFSVTAALVAGASPFGARRAPPRSDTVSRAS